MAQAGAGRQHVVGRSDLLVRVLSLPSSLEPSRIQGLLVLEALLDSAEKKVFTGGDLEGPT